MTKVQEFLDYQGTHFLTDITFGAKYLFCYKVSFTTYQQILDQGLDTSAAANYVALTNLAAGFKLTMGQKRWTFKTNVISLGLPTPNSADASTCASAVKDHPVPARYTYELY